MKDPVNKRFGATSEGTITAEQIDKDALIDTHYGAIAANAMEQKPGDLIGQQKAQDKFQKAFGLSWKDALEQGLVYNLVDGAAKLGLSMSQLGAEDEKLRKCEAMLRFGGGFYCIKIDRVFVIKGFFAYMREQLVHQAWHGRLLSPGRVERGSTQMGGLPRKKFRRHRPEDRLLHVPSLRRVQGLEGVGPRCRTQHWEQRRSTLPPARLRLWPSAPTGSACPWSPTASVE